MATHEELLRQQRQLELERERYRELFDCSSEASLRTDPSGTVTDASERCGDLLALTRPVALLGKPFERFVAPDDRQAYAHLLTDLAREASPHRWAATIVGHDDRRHRVVCHVVPQLDGDGTVVGLRWLIIEPDRSVESDSGPARSVWRQAMIDALPVGAFLVDGTGTCTYANDRTRAIAGRDLVGSLVSDWREPDDSDAGSQPRLPASDPGVHRYRMRRGGDAAVWVEQGQEDLLDDDGRVIATVGTLRDVTTEIGAARATETARQELEAILGAASDAIIVCDADQNLIVFNAAAETMFGYRSDELVGVPVTALVPPGLRALHAHSIGSFIGASGGPTPMASRPHVPAVRRNGEVFPADVTLSSADVDGRVLMIAIVRDETASVAAQRELEQAELRFGAAFEQALEGMFIAATDGRLLAVNRAFSEMAGAPERLLLTTRWVDLVHPEDRDRQLHLLESTLEAGSSGYRAESVRLRRPGGDPIWTSWTTSLVRNQEGPVEFLFGTVEDLTERRALEADLLQAQRVETLGQIIGGIAHDFNNILAVLSGHLEFLADEVGAGSGLERRVTSMTAAVQRGSSMIDRLLSLSRRPDHHPIDLDLHHRLDEFIELIADALGPGVRLDLRLEAAEPRVRCDPVLLEQVLLNLLVNARDAMDGEGSVTIATSDTTMISPATAPTAQGSSPRSAAVALVVTDTGRGMDDATLARIFEPFFTTKPIGAGTGFGLAQVRRLINEMGGSISVTSAPGRGSTFSVLMPKVGEAEPHVVERTRPSPSRVGTILVVDDEQDLRDLVAEILTGEGFEVVTAGGAREAVELFERTPDIGALVTDLIMPGATGLELVADLTGRHPDLPALVMSAHLDAVGPLDEHLARIRKPFTGAALVSALRALLDSAS